LDYLTTVEALLASARRKVRVISPFVDMTGVEVLSSASDRNQADPGWEVYVRTAPQGLLREARKRDWAVFEYRGTQGGDQRRGFHCKLVISDDEKAVVGSANLFYENLVENVELGVLLEGSAEVGPLIRVPQLLKRACQRVA
jgi:phosphatidylserine/phosphatidylglycerophosphate/cardiolipin synthase-like enzyme